MAVLDAGRPFFFDVGDLAVRREFPVTASHAAAVERGESEETNETAHVTPRDHAEQFPYLSAREIPRSFGDELRDAHNIFGAISCVLQDRASPRSDSGRADGEPRAAR